MIEGYWRDLLEGERRLRQEAERQLAAWRRMVEELAMEFAPGLDIASPDDVVKLAERMRELKEKAAEPWRSKYYELQEEMERLRKTLRAAEAETAEAEEVQQGQAAVYRPETYRPETHPVPWARVNLAELQELVSSFTVRAPFTQNNAPRAYMFFAVLGYLGLSGRPRVSAIVARLAGVKSAKTGSIQRVLKQLKKHGFVKLEKEEGAPFALIMLTERGKQFYRQISGRDPVPSEAELLLKTHPGSIAHAAFCVWVRELAEAAGYEVRIPAEYRGPWQPDLLFRNGEEVFGVEVERALNADPEARKRKWLNAQRTQGFAAVVAPDGNVREILKSELKKLGVRAKLTDISYVLESTGEGNFWAEEL